MNEPKRESVSFVSLAIVGDMEANREAPARFFDKVRRPELQEADIRFGGLESPLSNNDEPASSKIVMRHDPSMIAAYDSAGFDVAAFATNHCRDYGVQPFVATLDLLDRHGIR